MGNILVVDDEAKIRDLLGIILRDKGHQVLEAGDGLEALDILKENNVDVVISDLRMPRMGGIDLLNELNRRGSSVPVIFITAFATVDSAVDAMRRGAVDYITKPFDRSKITLSVEKALSLSRILDENRELREELYKTAAQEQIIAHSGQMRKVVELCSRVGRRDSTVLITGESGTGKGLIARFIHRVSPRRKDRFVALNCAAISPNLVESELFGHEKGAFTGAMRRQRGKFEFASGGTLFMDEIGDMPMEVQAKFLKAVEEKRIRRVGGNEEIDVDVRVICATNQDLEALVTEGRFRKDLFFRINVFPIHIPPLRERVEDIVPLAEYFISRYGGTRHLTEDAKRLLCTYPWPGNARELANAIERAIIIAGDAAELDVDLFDFLVARGQGCHSLGQPVTLPPQGVCLEELEKELARQALVRCGHNQSAAARMLGLTRAKFRVLMKRIKEGSGEASLY